MHLGNCRVGAAESDEPSLESLFETAISRPDLRKGGQVGLDHDIEILPGILQAHLDLVLPDQQPPMARIAAALGDAPEIEAQNKFLRRNIFAIDVLAYCPYQQLRIEIAGTDQPLSPFEPPFAHHLDHWPERLSGCRQRIAVASAIFLRIGMNDVGGRQFLQPLRQHGSDDQRRPSIAEDLGGLRDGAKLTVSDHELDAITGERPATSLISVLTLGNPIRPPNVETKPRAFKRK